MNAQLNGQKRQTEGNHRKTDVVIIEVGPRDGLQNLSLYVETERKFRLIKALAAAGLGEIQAGAFVSPRAIPQFRDMKDLSAMLAAIDGVTFSVLVPNLRGAREAVNSGVHKLIYFYSLTESHNLNNVRQTREESRQGLRIILEELETTGDIEIAVALATVFGCPFEGFPTTDAVLREVEEVAATGIGEITLCDTVGFGNPRQVEEILVACRRRFPETVFAVHFHNTRGLGLANALRAYEVGIRRFDAALGGLGGCPFAPGASGNIATEDLAFMFAGMGIATGIDLPALLEATRLLERLLPGVALTGSLYRAGLPRSRPLAAGGEDVPPGPEAYLPPHQDW
ncbi:MAG: hydroxymethylglutaryl-CoA lyase [Syntrophobacterales bacterium]|jgi:hydroxymethylglutaryl-CoA lyase|nr:hydroxymethylglutaryl-CoA lyase [Syntrophobacterales bacterium]